MNRAADHGFRSANVRLLLLAAAAACSIAVAQPGPEYGTSLDDEDEVVVELQRLAENDSNSPELIEPLKRLAIVLEERGDLIQAAAGLQRALQIVRINYGLHSLEQADLLRRLEAIEDARGNAPGAWALEQELLDLARRYPDDPRIVEIYNDAALTRFDAVDEYLDGGYPPEIELGCYFDRSKIPSNCTAGSQRVAIGAMLGEAHDYYEEGIYLILRRRDYANPELDRLESALLQSSYVNNHWIRDMRYYTGSARLSRLYLRESGHSIGTRSLSRSLVYTFARAEPLTAQMAALVRLADWQLLFATTNKEREAIVRAYEYAYAQLVSHGVPQASIDALFAPDFPVVIPDFMPNPLASADGADAPAHVDLSFEIGRYGSADKLELRVTGDAPRGLAGELTRSVYRGTFRPRLVDGRFADAVPVTVRYNVGE